MYHAAARRSFDRASAESIGLTLADWHLIEPEVLGQVQGVLLRAFTDDLPPHYIAALLPTLTILIEAVATGFTRRAQQHITSEQEQILSALLAEHTSVIEALRASEERLRTLVTNLPIIIFSVNRAGVITFIEGRGLEVIGHTASELVGLSIFDNPLIAPNLLANVRRTLAGESFTDAIVVGKRAFETRYAPLRGQDESVYALIGVAMDVTERWRMEVELTEARYLISESREDERRRLAHDLHDGVVQQLLGLSYQLEHARQRIHKDARPHDPLIEELTAIQQSVQKGMLDAVGQLRHTISELRPTGLDDLGLTTALENLVLQFEQEIGPSMPAIDLDLDPTGTDLPPPVASCLLRVAQEALRNALRYAQANHIAVILRIHEQAATLHIIDDGIGFQMPLHITQFVRAHHFGLIGLLEQVEYLSGSFNIWSEPGEGTEVAVEIPLRSTRATGTAEEQAFFQPRDRRLGLHAPSHTASASEFKDLARTV
jgi:PAS domain S-box-containing protein